MRRSTTLQKTLEVPLGSLKSEGHVSAFSCDATGRYAVLADTRGLTVMDLEYPYQQPRLLHHQTRAKVHCVRYSPHFVRKDYVASTSHSHALLWRVDDDYRPLVAGLRKHTRPIKDLCWSPSAPDVVATGALDGMVYFWDMRAHQAPCQSFSAGANKPVLQLSWNRQNPSLLATAHDSEVYVWDSRKAGPAASTRRFGVPGGAPRSMDWNPTSDSELVTCGSDSYIRLWDVSSGSDPLEGGLETLSIRAVADQVDLVRFTPFGQSGLVSVGKIKGYQSQQPPQQQQQQQQEGRHDILYLWALPATKAKSAESLQQVCRFEGHSAAVVAYDWRIVDNMVFQLVSLDEAQQLRLWRLDAGVLRACGHVNRTDPVVTLTEEDSTPLATGSSMADSATQPIPPPPASAVPLRNSHYDTISPALAAKLTPDALKLDLNPATVSQPQRPAPSTSTHAAVSVWQEMVEVEELARQGGLRDVDIEMVDVMSRTMRLSVGLVPMKESGASSSSTARGPSAPPSPHQNRSGGGSQNHHTSSGFRLLVTVEFPPSYPYGAMPKFTFRAVREDEEDEEDDDDDEQEEQQHKDQQEGAVNQVAGPTRSSSNAGGDSGWEGGGGDSGVESPTEGQSYSRRKVASGLLSPAGRELLTREVGDIARVALEAQLPCLERCIRHLEKTLAEAASAGILLITQSSSVGDTAGAGSDEARLQFAFDGAGGVDGGLVVSKAALQGEDGVMTVGGTTGKAQGANQLPCPRYGGAVFSGPNMLVLFNCALSSPSLSRTAGGDVHDDQSSGTTSSSSKPPRTYGNLLLRASGGGGPKGRLLDFDESSSTRVTPLQPRRFSAATPSTGGSGRNLHSPDVTMDQQRRRNSNEGGGGGGGGGELALLVEASHGAREGGGPASAMRLNSPLYSLYFMSPQSRLPLNHPDHDYSLQEPLSRMGMGMSSDDEGLAAAAFAQLNTQVMLLDASSMVPGRPELAVLYNLGPCHSTSSFSSSTATTTHNRTSGSRSTKALLTAYPIPSLPARRVSEPCGLPRPTSGSALATLANAVGEGATTAAMTHSTPNLSISPSTQNTLRRLAAETHMLAKPPSGRASFDRLGLHAREGQALGKSVSLDRPGDTASGGGGSTGGGGMASSQGSGGYSTSLQLMLANSLSGAASVGSSLSGLAGGNMYQHQQVLSTPTQSLRRHNSLITERDVVAEGSSHRGRRFVTMATDSPFYYGPSAAPLTTEEAASALRMPPVAYGGRQPDQQPVMAASPVDVWWKTHLAEARAISDACRANARAASKVGDEELVQVWMLLSTSTAACADDLQSDALAVKHLLVQQQRRESIVGCVDTSEAGGEEAALARTRATRSWKQGAFGKALVDNVLKYYEQLGDVQTLATIVCVLNVRHPYTLLQESKKADYDRYLHCYAELLFRWGALDLRADVLKRVSKTHLSDSFLPMDYLSIAMHCFRCGNAIDLSNFCDKCNTYPMKCVICQLAVKGQSMFCLACSHGGHTHHMHEWFSSNNVCPTGCGCRCLFSQSVNMMPRGGGSPSPLGELLAGANNGGFLGPLPLANYISEEGIMI